MTDHERDLRDALHARAGAMRVGRADEPGLLRRVAAARRRRRQARIAGAAAAVVVALGAASLVAADDPDRDTVIAGPDPSSTTTIFESSTTVDTTAGIDSTMPPPAPATDTPATTAAPGVTTTAAPPRATTTTAPLPPVPDDAVWPAPGSTATFSTPDRAANDFVRRFLRMDAPVLGQPKVNGATATVDVRPGPTAGLTTVVALRQVERRGWVVVGAAAPTIVVDQPTAGATVTSPLMVRGRAQAFEGHVDVEVRRDGATAPIGTSFGTGASDQMAPFEATVTFARPAVARGTVVVSAPNAEDGAKGPLAATVIRVAF